MAFTLDKDLIDTFDQIINAWGKESQFRILQEECGECVAAINQFYRGRIGSREKLISEVADVLITAFSVYTLLGPEVDAEIERKIARVKERLDKVFGNEVTKEKLEYLGSRGINVLKLVESSFIEPEFKFPNKI